MKAEDFEMSMISEQINKIRKVAKCVYLAADKEVADDIASTLNQAADTIETLFEKLQSVNMENGGGWIACEDRLPEEGKEVLVYLKQGRMTVAARIGKEWVRPDETRTAIVVAWRKLPSPYRP